MAITAGLWLGLLGVLGASNLIIARRPDAKELIDKFAPYQGWFGAISALWGAWIVLHSILNVSWATAAPLFWGTYLADGVVLLGLGTLLGVGVFKTFVKEPAAVAKLDAVVARLSPKQGVLGVAAMGLGAWMLVCSLLFYPGA